MDYPEDLEKLARAQAALNLMDDLEQVLTRLFAMNHAANGLAMIRSALEGMGLDSEDATVANGAVSTLKKLVDKAGVAGSQTLVEVLGANGSGEAAQYLRAHLEETRLAQVGRDAKAAKSAKQAAKAVEGEDND